MTTLDLHRPAEVPAFPADSRIAPLVRHADLADTFAIHLPSDASTDPEVLARFIFDHQAAWVGRLMRLRDAIMARFGVKTARQLRRSGERRVSIFRIYQRETDEIILGEDDRHLDFRVSVLRSERSDSGHAVLMLSTVVHCHNRYGRLYLFAIRPFHRLVVMSGLRRAARRGWPLQDAARASAP